MLAYCCLSDRYEWYVTALAYALFSFTATITFFGGTWVDGGWGFVYGTGVWYIGRVCQRFNGLPAVEYFISSLLISLWACAMDKWVYNGQLCLYAQLFGGIVWLLPGISITIALLEIYSRMIVYGSARLVHGISQAVQLGFGLMLGYKLVNTDNAVPDSFTNGCRDPVSGWYGLVLVPVCTVAIAVIINADRQQYSGMILSSGIGYLGFYILSLGKSGSITFIGDDGLALIGALIATGVARVYTGQVRSRPLVYIVSSLILLVPVSIGKKGMSSVYSSNADIPIAFTSLMLMIGICLAIGVFVALLPKKEWVSRGKAKNDTPAREKDIESQAQGNPMQNPVANEGEQ